jgi:hypothetical protein
MENRIRELTVRNGQMLPSQAEVWITVVPEHQTATTELRGRLMGPRCVYACTVEVAYPLRDHLPGHLPPGTPGITKQVIIPEPSFWDPESPFLYQAVIELWQDGQCCDQRIFSHGLMYLLLVKQGLALNGRPLILRGQSTTPGSEAEARQFHQAGYNLLVVPVEERTLGLWELADHLGMFLLGRVSDGEETTRKRLHALHEHPSCLGWLSRADCYPTHGAWPGSLVGLDCTSAPPNLPFEVGDFLFGPPERVVLGKPLLVTGEIPHGLGEEAIILGNVL